MSLYLILDLLVILFPFLLSFNKPISYYKKWKYVLFSLLLVGAYFIAWDSIATMRGDWSFNPEHLLGLSLIELPLEEILFFFVVPYSFILLFEYSRLIIGNEKFKLNNSIGLILAVFFLLAGFYFIEKPYTSTVLFSTGIAIILLLKFFKDLISEKAFWAYIAAGFLIFIAFNYVLTSLPIVSYSPKAITGIRFLTIPIEDFLYNFLMMSLYLAAFKWAQKHFETLKKIIRLGRLQFVFGGILLYALGSLLAFASGFSPGPDQIIAGYLVLFFAHLSVSYSNDYFDSEKDKDCKPRLFSGGSGVLVKCPELKRAAKIIALTLIALSFVAALMFIVLFDFSPLLLLYVLIGNLAGWYYSAPPFKFSKKLYGNLVFALTACILVPGFGNFIASGTITWEMLLFAIPMLFYGYIFTISVQIPDIEADRKNRARNHASIFGEKNSFKSALALAVLGSLSIVLIPVFFKTSIDYSFLLIFSLIPLITSLLGLLAKVSAEKRALLLTSSIMAFIVVSDIFLAASLFQV